MRHNDAEEGTLPKQSIVFTVRNRGLVALRSLGTLTRCLHVKLLVLSAGGTPVGLKISAARAFERDERDSCTA